MRFYIVLGYLYFRVTVSFYSYNIVLNVRESNNNLNAVSSGYRPEDYSISEPFSALKRPTLKNLKAP